MIRVAEEVRQALQEGRAVVALESTIVAHGMPYPDNLATGQLLEQTVRDHGAVPATIAVIEGALAVGISAAELERIAADKKVEKVSRRDLPFVLASRALGATTVSATMIGAARAGIAVFATGGIGGVHREVNVTLDISADLTELGRTNVCVVCAGVKSILDLPRTLEVLETLGVPVVGWGTSELPAFFTRTSGIALERRVEDADAMARILDAKWTLGLDGGVVLTVPPPEHAALLQADIDPVIEAALAKARALGIQGKATTPFLLRELREATQGKSLAANIALAVQNAHVAAEVAVAYARMRKTQG